MNRNMWTDLRTWAMITMLVVGFLQTVFVGWTPGAIWTVGGLLYGAIVSKGWDS